jgi:hypothetical protein
VTAEPTRLPVPAQTCQTCGAPARMALGMSASLTAVDPAGNPRPRGYVHEAVYWDWRAAPSIAGVRFFCKADGTRVLVDLADIFVSCDREPELDPWSDPADPNVTFLERVRRDTRGG